MRVFVTGAGGWIGSAVVPELLGAGHQVLGLARSDDAAAALRAAGAEVHLGSLDDLDGLARAAAASDGVIHLAFELGRAGFAAAGAADVAAIRSFGAALEGTGKPLVITSGTLMIAMIAPGRLGTEDIRPPAGTRLPRVASEAAALAVAGSGVRTSVVRLAPTVHGDGDRGFVPGLIRIARDTGVAGYVGDGSNRWPAVHREDAARLYRSALEDAPAGSVLHGAGEEGVPFRDIAEVVGRHLGVPTAGIDPEDAAEHFGFLGAFVGVDNPTSSALTRELVGWRPDHPGLLDDLDAGHYFAAGATSKF
jgi:nucleoside-diphosphate-sugar epimerase